MFQDFEHFFGGNTIYRVVFGFDHLQSSHTFPSIASKATPEELEKAGIQVLGTGSSGTAVNNLYIPAMWGPIVISIIHHIIIGVINQLCYLGGGTLC